MKVAEAGGSPSRSSNASSSSPSPSPSYQRYLKPGALAKLRDSKITAAYRSRSRASHSKLLLQLPTTTTATTTYPSSSSSPPLMNMDESGFPCFESTRTTLITQTPSLHRKKLFAVTPFFTDDDQTHHTVV